MNRPDDDLHDPLLSRLYRELPEEQPGADTDATIRAAARRAVGAGPRRQGLSATSRITATAAALVLGVALTVQWQREDPERLREALAPVPGVATPAPREDVDRRTAPLLPPAPEAPAMPAASAPARGEPPPAKKDSLAALASGENSAGDSAVSSNPDTIAREAMADVEKPSAPVEAPAPALKRKQEAEADNMAAAKATEAFAGARLREESRRSMDAVAAATGERTPAAQPQAPSPSPAPSQVLAQTQGRTEALAGTRAQATGGDTPADYRSAMAGGRLAEAMALLPADASPGSVLDRDLLRAASGRLDTPACSRLAPPPAGGEALLCEFLRLRTGGEALPPDWRARLEASGAVAGERAYRRAVTEKIWSAPARP